MPSPRIFKGLIQSGFQIEAVDEVMPAADKLHIPETWTKCDDRWCWWWSCRSKSHKNRINKNESNDYFNYGCIPYKNIMLKTLVDSGDLKTDTSGKIINPTDDSEIDLENSGVSVTYDCDSRTFSYNSYNLSCE